ncbi:uncharacterized protein LOC112053492 isoform X2 [Bicyclus anynana]|uniref:Uncharacterized protein LOC112053492 isoform X2 n=1 Tax=Bicyclus anynana TaxID=110368 RepID=A0ABM3LGL0_BICAN|nr:uncharacterized protein LOC112053492 isoform X2 [Bicyclus anynana]
MNLSFAGCGFLGIYHVGVAVCLKKYAPQLLIGNISGASFGALSACCLLCNLPIGDITSDVLRIVGEARAGSLGPFSPSFSIQNLLLEGMQNHIPHNAHEIVSGKLHISLTRVYDGNNVIVSEFPTREDLLQALLASCFVPVFSGMLPPRFHGIRYMDGGFSDNLPVLDENTITVSPFCGESDICPRDVSSQLFHVNIANTSIELSRQNINRFARILFPPKPEVLSNMCKQGFDDALRYLHSNKLISCTRCLEVQTTFRLQDVLDDSAYEYDPECEQCKTHREVALVDDLPDTVMTIFQQAIDSANTGIVNWVMRQRGMRCVSLLTLPYRVPVDIMYATVTKFVACTPKMSKSLWKLSWKLLRQLHAFVYSAHDRSDAARIYLKLSNHREEHHRLDKRRASELRASYGDVPADNTFEHIFNVTANNDALLAYYYLDSDNKMKMTEIYDVTDADTDAVQSPTERDANTRLEYDNEDWSGALMADDVLEHIDCERLAKTVNKRAVILTNFMLSNLMEAISQLLCNTTLLTSLQIEGLPLKIPYLNPLNEALLRNTSLQHLYLPRCLIGDAGCLAICKAVRCLPNILTMDLSGCELTPLGAGYIADLLKYQKIHRYSENWVHTLRYRLPELDTMAGLRRITLCGNTQLGDAGLGKLLDVLADDLWIKALDVQNCGLTEESAAAVLQMMASNTTIVVLDVRHNVLSSESLSKIRSALRQNERGIGAQYSWLGNLSSSSSEGRIIKSVPSKNGITKDRAPAHIKTAPSKYNVKSNIVKKERDYTELLEEQLQDETSHRRQLEELNERLVQQMKSLKQQQIQLWQNSPSSSSEQSFQGSSRSGDLSNSSGSSSSVPIDQSTLSYIQQAFKDIYAFIKNNQCHGQCHLDIFEEEESEEQKELIEPIAITEVEKTDVRDVRVNIVPKKAQSTHWKLTENVKKKKITQSAHLLGATQRHVKKETTLEMVERQMGDTTDVVRDDVIKEVIAAEKDPKRNIQDSPRSSVVSDSSDTLVYSPKSPHTERVYHSPCVETVYESPRRESVNRSIAGDSRENTTYQHYNLNPRNVLYSSSDEDS